MSFNLQKLESRDKENWVTMKNTEKYKGIIVPMVTPLMDERTLDERGLKNLIEHIISGGVHGLFLLGSTGEGPSLSHEIRRALVEKTIEQVNQRVPALVCVTDSCFTESVDLAEYAAAQGADAVVVAPPYYFSQSQPELIEYMKDFADAVSLPVFIYNMPSFTKMHFDIKTVETLMLHDNIIGYKDSGGSMAYSHNILRLFRNNPEWLYFVGPEDLMAESVLMGAHGGVSGGANAFPSLYVKLYEAAKAEDVKTMRELQFQVMDIFNTIYQVGQYGSSFLKSLKCSLKLLGICNHTLARPYKHFHEPEEEKIRSYLIDLGFLKLSE